VRPIGHSRCLTWPPGGPAPVDPATLPLTLWLQGGNYDGPPTGTWHGTPSAGTSGSNNVIAVRPTNDGSLDGHTIINFDGVDNQRFNGGVASTYFDVAGSSSWALVNVTSELSDLAPGSNSDILGDQFTFFGLSTRQTAPKAQAFIFNSPVYKHCEATLTNGIWQFLQWRHDGVTLELRNNRGPWSSAAAGPIENLSGILAIGINYENGATGGYNGNMIDIGAIKQVLTTPQFDGIYAFMKTRYPSAGLP
jgi:hypothetical protein